MDLKEELISAANLPEKYRAVSVVRTIMGNPEMVWKVLKTKDNKLRQLESSLTALVEKWREQGRDAFDNVEQHTLNDCADELEAIYKRGE